MILVTSTMLCCERTNYNVTKIPIITKFDSITHNTLKKTPDGQEREMSWNLHIISESLTD